MEPFLLKIPHLNTNWDKKEKTTAPHDINWYCCLLKITVTLRKRLAMSQILCTDTNDDNFRHFFTDKQ
jgi:hypothetical protein